MTSGGWIFRRRCRLSGDCWSFPVFFLFSAEWNDFVQVSREIGAVCSGAKSKFLSLLFGIFGSRIDTK